MATLLERIGRAQRVPLHAMSAPAARAAYVAAAEVLDLPRTPLHRVQDLLVPTVDGVMCAARLYDPGREDPSPALLYFHGGGFVIGGLETHDSLCRQFALRSGAAVVALDYRLAPEHRFPAAVDDAFAALRWLQASAAVLGLDAQRLAVGGDSAGGTLAAVCAVLARDAGLPLALQLLITPGTAACADTPSHRQFGKGFLLDAEAIAWFFDQYIPLGERDDWRFAPLNATDLEGVAPACVILAECDPVVDEGLAYTDRLRLAGVPVELELYRGLTHDFIKMGRALPEAKHAQQAAALALRKAFSP
jgi:acetyl esterase